MCRFLVLRRFYPANSPQAGPDTGADVFDKPTVFTRVARSLWRSMAIARAYEFSVYVGISDWAYPCEYHGSKSSSVAGFADPRPLNGDGFFTRIGGHSLAAYDIDLARLRELRRYRNEHAFLSDETLVADILLPRRVSPPKNVTG